MSRVALCKDADARREARRVATTTRKPRNAADAPCRRNPWGRVDLRLGVVGPSSFGSTKHRRSRLAQAQIYLGRGHVESSGRLLAVEISRSGTNRPAGSTAPNPKNPIPAA